MGLTRGWARIGAAIVVAAIGSGCSALTGFGDLTFDGDGGAVGRDGRVPVRDGAGEAEARDSGPDSPAPPPDAGPDAPPPDGDPPPRDLGPDVAPMDGDLPPMDGDVPPMDVGPPPADIGPFDVGPPPPDTAAIECRSDPECDDSEQCTLDSCDMATARCVNLRLNLTACDDGNACTRFDTCRAGTCIGTAEPCVPSGPCVASFCDATFGCVDENVPAGVSCEDETACSPSSMCDGLGSCVGEGDCMSDGNPCTAELCAGTTCESVPVMDGNPCATGQCCNGACVSVQTDEANCGMCDAMCMTGLSCVGGVCSSCGADSACNDGLACTTDACVGTCTNTVTTGCVINGACVATDLRNPDNPCEACRPSLSTTSWSPRDDGSPCNDGLFCTMSDECVGGHCEGSVDPCSDMTGGCFEWRCNEAINRCDRLGGCPSGFACCDDMYCAVGGLCL